MLSSGDPKINQVKPVSSKSSFSRETDTDTVSTQHGQCCVKECRAGSRARWARRVQMTDRLMLPSQAAQWRRKEQRVQRRRAVMGLDRLVQYWAGSVLSLSQKSVSQCISSVKGTLAQQFLRE